MTIRQSILTVVIVLAVMFAVYRITPIRKVVVGS